MREPIPHRMPGLSWRKPAFLWTPIALTAAIAWPIILFQDDPSAQRMALTGQFATFALALAALGVSWGVGRPPRTRRAATLYVVWAGALVALAGPLATGLIIDGPSEGGLGTLAAAPLAAVVGLPIALVSGLLFAWLALKRRPAGDEDENALEAQITRYEPFG